MALSCCCCCCCYISILLILSSTQVRHSAEGRALPELNAEVAREESSAGDVMVGASSVIGSRPPRCERRCIACGHCEAVQVPVVPPQVKRFGRNAIDSRAEDSSNYKPMSWKCKCGNRILNP